MSEKININGINFQLDNCPSKDVQTQTNNLMKIILNKYNYSTIVDVIYKPEIANLPQNKDLLNILNEMIKNAGIEYISLFLISFRHKKKQVSGANDHDDKNLKLEIKDKLNK